MNNPAAIQTETKPRRRPTQDRSIAMVNRILEATETVLMELGYDNASTNKIAKQAGISVGTLYHYFPNKKSVVAAVIERFARGAEKAIMTRLMELIGESYSTLSRAVLETYIDFLEQQPQLLRVIVEQTPKIGDSHKISSIEKGIAASARRYLTYNQKKLGIENIEAATFLSINTISLLCNRIVLDPPDGVSTQVLIDEIHKMLIRYIKED